ncbi:MAG: DUF748 domain-containing protein, partial [Candidatus Omnitrophica bacterium]|nr:DUF748 domain-containing protein [Candidatus Omnitrophota bacterium]
MQRRRRKKIIFIFLAALILIVSAASAYMNALALASNMKLALMNEIEGATRKKLFFQSIRVNPATGLVIDGPVLYDGSSVVFRAKKASCLLLAMPVLKKMIIIPELKIESPTLLVERMPDNSFPILELIPKEYISPGGLNVAIRRLKLKNGSIEFVDHTLEPPFKKRLTKADLDIRFSIRNKVVFTFSGALETDPPAGIKASGEYSVPKDELRAECVIDDIQLMDFTEYYGASGFYFPEGTVGAKISIDSAGGIIDAGIKAETKRLNVLKDNISARVDSFIKAYVRYDTRSGQTEYAGTADIRSMDISGIEAIGELSGIKAKVEFDDSRLSSDNVLVEALGIQWKVKINLVNYNDPILDIY